METNVWSVTIKGKNDCVALSDFEAMQVKMKFMPDIEMYNMTERHGMKVSHLHKEHRMQDVMPEGVTWVGDKPPSQTYIKAFLIDVIKWSFLICPILEARVEIQKYFRRFFGSNEKFRICFRD